MLRPDSMLDRMIFGSARVLTMGTNETSALDGTAPGRTAKAVEIVNTE